MIMFKAEARIVRVFIYCFFFLTLVDASMFSGSMRVLRSPISCTAPPNSGSESQIICLITTFISNTSYGKKKDCQFCKFNAEISVISNTQTGSLTSFLLAYIICLLRFLHDKLSDHGGAEFHQVWEDVCRCSPHLQIIHSLNKRKAVATNVWHTEFHRHKTK